MPAVERSSSRRKRFRAALKATGAGCHICGRSIDYNLPHLDPLSFVVDHVKPLAKGGTDTRDNVRAAHRSCNSTKRARLVAPILKRSGSLD